MYFFPHFKVLDQTLNLMAAEVEVPLRFIRVMKPPMAVIIEHRKYLLLC